MRRAMILVLSALPLLAQGHKAHPGPVSTRLSNASVLFGPGIVEDRSGEKPAPPFKTNLTFEVGLEGVKADSKPRFRFWLVKASDEEKLKGASPRAVRAKELGGLPGPKTESGYPCSIHWTKGDVDPDDRLFVEVFIGRRRVATAMSAIQSHYLPASHPRGGEEKN